MSDNKSIMRKMLQVMGGAEPTTKPVLKESVAPSKLQATINKLEAQYANIKEGKEHANKDAFDSNANVGDTYKTSKGTVTKTSSGIKHERGAGKEEKDELDESDNCAGHDDEASDKKLIKKMVKKDALNPVNEEQSDEYGYTYRLLGRLQADCDYFLAPMSRSSKQLWAGSVADQIAKMKELWNSLPADGKPQWLSMEDILQYEKDMSSSPEGFGPEDEVQDTDLRADPSKPAYIKKVTENDME